MKIHLLAAIILVGLGFVVGGLVGTSDDQSLSIPTHVIGGQYTEGTTFHATLSIDQYEVNDRTWTF